MLTLNKNSTLKEQVAIVKHNIWGHIDLDANLGSSANQLYDLEDGPNLCDSGSDLGKQWHGKTVTKN